MNNASYIFREPKNEPVYSYAPGTPERAALKAELEKQYNQCIEIPLIIGGKDVKTGDMGTVVMPTEHKHVLAKYHKVGKKEVQMAIDAAMAAREKWESMPWIQRASIMMKAAELLATKYRYVLNAATMLGQGKSPMQAEIDCPCEAIDFLRFNTYFASKIYAEQPISDHTMLDRNEYRGMEGFVYAITPFNFTSIALNLNVAPALMGNVTIWKPSTTAILSNYYLMRLLQEAGLPDGVINFLPGSGSVISEVAFKSPYLAGIHFTGSTGTFKNFWKLIGQNIDIYKTYPKIVGETGGKDFIFAHKTAPARELAVAILRGAFEYQGQKCSAASRAYVPKSLWPKTLKHIQEMMKTVKMGDGRDFGNLINAVIDEKSFDNIAGYIDRAKKSPDAEIVLGGGYSKKVGYFVEPTIIVAKTPDYESMREEIFGPVITIYVYPDAQFEKTLKLCDETSPYALTGSIFATDRYAIEVAEQALRHAAGNFYINDKPTGAVVGCQPFGGARASGTNDKAGSALNLYRWISARCIKETFVPATDYGYPFLKEE
ncbi:MAG: L-glutamate gamma-semialdehyde dehydrogenase [Bacteroidales bacterium]|jgi:1-pyrroline-5-carboxylate dehydrogenase|nr:L-glutamate gamma-semialdehyde dehydrogenase [Bacteroidales bacterium]MBQ6668253.1 L-glutamate gamma-semialdehyde dehydrogenase [Bacteroidales bacterium]MCR5190423.1 L-glutamate gamma-semialdehyde dehydrogenase [Bacteroidales bacterium]